MSEALEGGFIYNNLIKQVSEMKSARVSWVSSFSFLSKSWCSSLWGQAVIGYLRKTEKQVSISFMESWLTSWVSEPLFYGVKAEGLEHKKQPCDLGVGILSTDYPL